MNKQRAAAWLIVPALITGGVNAATIEIAAATHPLVEGDTYCDTTTGQHVVMWKVGGDTANPSATATIKTQSLATDPTLVGKSVKNTQTVSGTQTGSVASNTTYTMTVKVQFTNHSPGDLVTQSDSVKTGGTCTQTVKDASASLSITPATCTSPEKLVLGKAINATWGTPSRTSGPGPYSAKAAGNAGPPQHLFLAGSGVSPDGKTKTFTGNLKGKDTSKTCATPPPPYTCPSGTTWVDKDNDGVVDKGECTTPPGSRLWPTAKARAYCLTPHWGEGVVRIINKKSTQSTRVRIARSGKDRIVTVDAGKSKRVELRHLRVGSMVKVKIGKKVFARVKVTGGCNGAPPAHTGERSAAG